MVPQDSHRCDSLDCCGLVYRRTHFAVADILVDKDQQHCDRVAAAVRAAAEVLQTERLSMASHVEVCRCPGRVGTFGLANDMRDLGEDLAKYTCEAAADMPDSRMPCRQMEPMNSGRAMWRLWSACPVQTRSTLGVASMKCDNDRSNKQRLAAALARGVAVEA